MIEKYKLYFNNMATPWENSSNKQGLNLVDAILLSWPFLILQNLFYFVLTGLFFRNFLSAHQGIINSFGMHFSAKYPSLTTVFYLGVLEILFFPITIFLSYYLWKMAFMFIGWWFQIDDDEMGEDLYSASLSSYVFLIVPVLGSLFQKLTFYFLMFRGIKERTGIGSIGSSIVLLLPMLIILFLVCSMFLITFVFLMQLLS